MADPTAPIVINNIDDLEKALNSNLSGNYVLGGNIDASGYDFTPIGATGSQIAAFTGTLNGAGYTISNLTIDASFLPPPEVGGPVTIGMFDTVGAGGLVENLGLTNVSLTVSTAPYPPGASIGGLAGELDGTIRNSYVTGNVTLAAPPQQGSALGGLVGEIGRQGYLASSFSLASVSGSAQSVGGLVGFNNGTIIAAYARGPVTDPASVLYFLGGAGGAIGGNSGTIDQVYATGMVSSALPASNVGGVLGQNYPQYGGTLTNSYWDPISTGQPATSNSLGTPLNTSDFQSGSLPPGFDPTVWGALSGAYPYLLWQQPTNSPPVIDTSQSTVTGLLSEKPGTTGDPSLDYANLGGPTTPSGAIVFSDPDLSDRPKASILSEQVLYYDANGNLVPISAAETFIFENAFSIAPELTNNNAGKIDWTIRL